jgi:Xaa-Pro aminopeptidase
LAARRGGAWAILPLEGELAAIVSSEREHTMWKANLQWPADLRWGNGSELVPERLRELGLAEVRVGVSGLVDQYHRAEGVIPFETWTRITNALPKVRFEPATEVLNQARVVKGPEEVAVIQAIVDANEAAIARMIEVSSPGVEEATVWLEVAKVLMGATYDYPARLSLGSNGRPANAGNTMALPIAMQDGGILSQEIDARLQGYRAQCNHSILVGSKNADAYREAMLAAIETFHALVSWVKPGETVGGLLDTYEQTVAKLGASGGGVLIQTNGLGADKPRVGPSSAGPERDMLIEPGWTFTIKTTARMTSTGVMAMVGEPMTVSEQGARRLGHRPLEPVVTG